MLKIYNTLGRKKEDFIPQNPPRVTMYTCGVTVYDDCHIGHARSLYIFDVMRRYLKYRGYDVKFVRNITDIDDKIINRANELKVNWQELVKKYIERYYEDLTSLGIEKADFEPRATENIPEMIRYIQKLIEKDFAYVSGGDVYFNVRKFGEYGKLSGQKIEEMESGVRISPTELKKDHLDFALWKGSKEGEPFWESPWGNGRPGWHIECSVMSQKFLKTDTLDVHAGGRDLVFPHHENELAQAEGCTGKPFVKYWIHHGLLTINGQKMAKSLGNFITVKDALKKYPASAIKLLMLMTHYGHPLDFAEKNIRGAVGALQKFKYFFYGIQRRISFLESFKPEFKEDELKKNAEDVKKEVENCKEKFIKAMDDDFNTPEALAVIFEVVKIINKYIQPNIKSIAISVSDLEYIRNSVTELASIFGLSLQKEIEEVSSEQLMRIEPKINERDEARKQKNFKKADEIRDELLEKEDIVLEDTPEGTLPRKRYKHIGG